MESSCTIRFEVERRLKSVSLRSLVLGNLSVVHILANKILIWMSYKRTFGREGISAVPEVFLCRTCFGMLWCIIAQRKWRYKYERQDVWRICIDVYVYLYCVEPGHFLSLQRGYNNLAGPQLLSNKALSLSFAVYVLHVGQCMAGWSLSPE